MIHPFDDIFKQAFPQHRWHFDHHHNFSVFPPKHYQLGAKQIKSCNKKIKWVLTYLTFLHFVYKFVSNMMCFESPTSIVAFGGKSKKLRWQLNVPLMLGESKFENVIERMNHLQWKFLPLFLPKTKSKKVHRALLPYMRICVCTLYEIYQPSQQCTILYGIAT